MSSFLTEGDGLSPDPYSLQMSLVFPRQLQTSAVPPAGQEPKLKGFRALVEKIVREETPAHIRVRVHWLDADDLRAFDEAYFIWVESIRQRTQIPT